MLNYKFNCGLVRTSELLRATSIPRSTLEYWKFEWRKKGKKTYDMGLRLIGNKAYWEPVQFVNWIAQFKLTNKQANATSIFLDPLVGGAGIIDNWRVVGGTGSPVNPIALL